MSACKHNYKIPSDASDMMLYVETAEGTMNFYIDEAIGAVAGTVIDGPKEINLILGDVNFDGKINALDVSMAKQTLLSKNYAIAADVNQNGVVDSDDIKQIKAFVLGNIDKFTKEEEKNLLTLANIWRWFPEALVQVEPRSATAERQV